MANILIIEDDKAIANLYRIAFKLDGYQTFIATSALDGTSELINNLIDLIIMDLGLPDLDGKELLKTIRGINETIPLIVVSARLDEKEKVECLDLGANDYVTKPFSTNELMARVRSLLRFKGKDNKTESGFENGKLKIDYLSHIVTVDKEEVHLTNFEYKLLCLLAKNIGKTLTHQYIIDHVWGKNGTDSSSLRVFMAGLRRKIERDYFDVELFHTEVGIGYRMNRL